MKVGKHVIFLGAGASYGSGYPLANELRLLISSPAIWTKKLNDYQNAAKRTGTTICTLGSTYWKTHSAVLNLFRNGGFATLDEFCKLAAGKGFDAETNGLRCLVRAALALCNPEEHFENSEYYGFVQSVFEDDLISLRDDISVLTYNYDPYLEFLLYRALETRRRVIRNDKAFALSAKDTVEIGEHESRLNAVTSGFYEPRSLKWAEADKAKPSFCVLQLHGSICREGYLEDDFRTLFSTNAEKRAEVLFANTANPTVPPVFFPWEVVTGKGVVDSKPLFRAIWERARRDVEAAKKISFVGLCMHEFLLEGLEYLFQDKRGTVEVVVANPANEFQTPWLYHPHTPSYAVNDALLKVGKKMNKVTHSAPSPVEGVGPVTPVKDFASFIKTQMRPVRP